MKESIVAGRKLDLSGVMSCPAYECMRENIDSNFRRIWHYFDQIVVEGLSPIILCNEMSTMDTEEIMNDLRQRIFDQARVVLYLRSIGADRFVVFSHKPHAFCEVHWQKHAQDLGLARVLDEASRNSTVQRITKTSDFLIEDIAPGTWSATVTGKYFSKPFHSLVYGPADAAKPEPENVARMVISQYAKAMVSDVGLARRLGLPLVESVHLPWRSANGSEGAKANEIETSIQLDLPVFDSLTTENFLKLREDERPDFEAYRAALLVALSAQSQKDPSRSPQIIAKAVEDEYLRPGLAEIEKRVRRRRSALIKKTAVNLSIGTATAAIGAIASVPLVIESLAAIGSTIPLAPIFHGFIDEGETIKMSELYFLWQADKKAKHH